jgi:hypothetical protein
MERQQLPYIFDKMRLPTGIITSASADPLLDPEKETGTGLVIGGL